MTFNLSLITPDYGICATDRRLTTPAGKIVTERSNKLTLIEFTDGHGFITYTGIGSDFGRRTPTDWIANIADLGRLSVDDTAAAIKQDAEPRLSQIARRGFDVRHSFVMGGFRNGIPFLLLISNYDELGGTERSVASPELSISGAVMNLSGRSSHPYLVLATGARPRRPSRLMARLLPALKAGHPPQLLRKLAVKAVRDVAYQGARRASVGSSVQSVVIHRGGRADCLGHIPGGTTLLEGPNMIGGGMRIADLYVDVSGDPQWRYDPALRKARIAEPACASCGAPVPEGYRLCGVCDSPVERPSGQGGR